MTESRELLEAAREWLNSRRAPCEMPDIFNHRAAELAAFLAEREAALAASVAEPPSECEGCRNGWAFDEVVRRDVHKKPFDGGYVPFECRARAVAEPGGTAERDNMGPWPEIPPTMEAHYDNPWVARAIAEKAPAPRGALIMRCWFCKKPFENDRPACNHPEITEEVSQAAQILNDVDFCDHFCCGMPANLCRSVRLSKALAEKAAPAAPPPNALNEVVEEWKRRAKEFHTHVQSNSPSPERDGLWEQALTYETCVEEIEALLAGVAQEAHTPEEIAARNSVGQLYSDRAASPLNADELADELIERCAVEAAIAETGNLHYQCKSATAIRALKGRFSLAAPQVRDENAARFDELDKLWDKYIELSMTQFIEYLEQRRAALAPRETEGTK